MDFCMEGLEDRSSSLRTYQITKAPYSDGDAGVLARYGRLATFDRVCGRGGVTDNHSLRMAFVHGR